jgi:predicted methyltransferase
MNEPTHRWRRPVKVLLFLFGAILFFVSLNTAYDFLSTLDRLKLVEAERDQWQRPSDVLQALDLRRGNVVVDLGSGAGYFTLKLAPIVSTPGKVIAVDVRRLSLLFLRVRAFLHNEHNVEIIVGDQDDPHLPTENADSVLICNTYHEFRNQRLMLDHAFRALRPGGRLVIVEREPRVVRGESNESATHNHEIPAVSVESELRRRGFEILTREESFINRPGDDVWWLIVARKPEKS